MTHSIEPNRSVTDAIELRITASETLENDPQTGDGLSEPDDRPASDTESPEDSSQAPIRPSRPITESARGHRIRKRRFRPGTRDPVRKRCNQPSKVVAVSPSRQRMNPEDTAQSGSGEGRSRKTQAPMTRGPVNRRIPVTQRLG